MLYTLLKISFFTLFVLISCTTSNKHLLKHNNDKNASINDNFKILNLDSTTFKEFIFIELLDKYKKNFYLLSKRSDTLHFSDSIKYEILKFNETYNITIIRQDSVIIMKPRSLYKLGRYVDIEKNIIIWSRDTIRTTVFMSPNVIDKYVEIKK